MAPTSVRPQLLLAAQLGAASPKPGQAAPAVDGKQQLADAMERLLGRLRPPGDVDRRCAERYAMPLPLVLTPLDADGNPSEQEAMIVVGRNLSRRGIGFSHSDLLRCRRAVLRLEDALLGRMTVEVEIAWRRFTTQGRYEYGAHVRRLLPDRVAPARAG
ncbi:hypothetical protein Pla175_42760 [Pirellulimonas nuda]|uniref:PilZ domain-containing protein n=1 Tax=Pirellulimonas nuda TaxID=2528009 RepID=A0A518DHA9_9BACT|nr:hypothetical protein [Pirellulimonas nuda]QDU90863.1 hypothetical protein Pla175_42760 [Pirellulimonas nuda]